ncbi:transposable element Tc1 transposase [Trichonephila clavipes]|uniref:Transposable element Tc1 transposase n=1 Tax=Trichonephila clavipes TaxID=2585209 RepID=A0A8X6WJ99_TRICX|nr:transposable element Tc1 transposase [Trichonephila clavipes]
MKFYFSHVRLFRGAVGDKFVFMDDNATCHRTLTVQDCLDSEGIQCLVWPARSPDLNPIKNVWDALGRQVAGRNYPPTNKNTLIRALTEEWDKLPQQLLDNVVQSMLAVGKSWSRLLSGQRRAQISALPRMQDVACLSVITGNNYLQADLLNIGLSDSPLCPLCKSVSMTEQHLFDCPTLLHIISQDNCEVLPPASATSALYWTARRLKSERTLAGVT